MYKILIADDDMIVRQYLSQIIRRDLTGFTLCASAKDGAEALRMIEEHQPDLAILDIDMPDMDGVEVLRTLYESHAAPHTKVLVLSCYNDFDYVKNAMRYGAVDYILKHKVDSDTLIKMLESITNGQPPIRVSTIKKHNQSKKSIIRQGELLDMLLHRDSTLTVPINGLAEQARTLGVLPYNILIAVGSIDYLDKFMTYNSDDEIRRVNAVIMEIFENAVAKLPNSLAACIEEDKYIAVFSRPQKMSIQIALQSVHEILNGIHRAVTERLHLTMTIGLSKSGGSIANLAAYYQQALEALRYKLYAGINNTIWQSKCMLSQEVPQTLYAQINRWSQTSLFSREAEKQLDVIFTELSEHRLDFAQYHLLLLRLVGILLGSVEDPNVLVRVFDGLSPAMTFFGCETWQDHRTWFLKHLKALRENGGKQSYRAEICAAIRYIEEHLDEDISLTAVAAHVNFSKNYFSQLFKQSTGENLVDYIARLRISRAKELLVNPNYKIYEVAARVGFDSQAYFNRLFKNLEGLTPTEYRYKYCFEHERRKHFEILYRNTGLSRCP